MATINTKISPLNMWWEKEYEETRFTQRYKFIKADSESVRRGVIDSAEKIGLTISSSTDDIVASGNPTTMFTSAECEDWKRADENRTKQLSSGLIVLTCDASNKNSVIVATVRLKAYPKGTLIVLDYEMKNPKMDAYGVIGPRRPTPAASLAGSTKFWRILGQALAQPISNASKDDLL
jgi:hypothetical protein